MNKETSKQRQKRKESTIWYHVIETAALFKIAHMTRLSLFRAQEPKAHVTYCDHALSVVCRPSVRPLDNLHFGLFL